MCHGVSIGRLSLAFLGVVAISGPAAAQTVRPRIIEWPFEAAQVAAFIVERPTLGIRVAPVSEAARREHGLTTRRGALVVDVDEGSPAAKVGLDVGMVIVAVDGRRIDSPQDLVEFVRSARSGQDVELTYYEADQLRRKRVRLDSTEPGAERPEGRAEAEEGEDAEPAPRVVPTPPRPGVEGPPLDPPLVERQPLRRLERVLDGLARPAPDPAAPGGRDAELRAEVDRLRQEVIELRRALVELEERLAALEPRKPTPPDASDDRPGLK